MLFMDCSQSTLGSTTSDTRLFKLMGASLTMTIAVRVHDYFRVINQPLEVQRNSQTQSPGPGAAATPLRQSEVLTPQ